MPFDRGETLRNAEKPLQAGKIDNAVAKFTRIAARLSGEGFLSKAIALHRTILKLKPDEENSMVQLGDLSAKQGLMVEFRAGLEQLKIQTGGAAC